MSQPEPEEAGPPAEFDEFTVVLLVRPPDAPELDDGEAERLQRQHLGHLRAMQRQGTLLAAGPLREQPDPAWRGLCLYRVGLVEALRLSGLDPAVRRGRFVVTAWTWLTPKGAISPGATPWGPAG